MNRGDFLKRLAVLPLIGKLIPQDIAPAARTPEGVSRLWYRGDEGSDIYATPNTDTVWIDSLHAEPTVTGGKYLMWSRDSGWQYIPRHGGRL